MGFAFGETVVRQRPATSTDRYGAPVEDWTNPTSVDLEKCAVYPGATGEPLMDARVPVDSDFTVLARPGSDVTARDRVVIRGVTCNVNGRPFRWINPLTGTDFGIAFGAKVREG